MTTEVAAYNDPIVFARRILGFEPHPAQQAILRSRARTRIVAAGRGFGKSVVAAIDLSHFGVSHPGSKQLLVAPTTDQARIIFDDVATRLKVSALGGLIADVQNEPHPEIVLSHGELSYISARPSSSSSSEGSSRRTRTRSSTMRSSTRGRDRCSAGI